MAQSGSRAGSSSSFIPPGVVTESDALLSAPLVCREPYRVFFPAGICLAWAGVLHWLLHATGALSDYRPVFHAMTQIQGFLMCFALGFLFTMIPRRTGTAPPSRAEILLCLTCAIMTSVMAWHSRFGLAQVFWLGLAATVVAFVVRRFLSQSAKRRPPNSFVWIPLAILMGVMGSLLTGSFAVLGPEYAALHTMGKGLILQGMFCGFVFGVGGLAIPLMTRSEPPPDSTPSGADRMIRALHIVGALLLILSFWLESTVSIRQAYALRALVSLVALVYAAKLWKPPAKPGLNRWWIWTSAWMIPLGFALATLFPMYRLAALHVVFIGGFAFMALCVSTQVTLGHGGDLERLAGRPWQSVAAGVLVLVAVAARWAMEIDRANYFLWMGVAAGAFLATTIVWANLVGPYLLKQPST